MDSISYITKQHCRSGISVLCAVLMTVMAVIGFAYAKDNRSAVGLLFACLMSVQALTGWLMLISPRWGSLLLQFPTGLWAALCFAASLFLLPAGYLFITRGDMQDYCNKWLADYGYRFVSQPTVTGGLFIVGGLLAFLLSCQLLFFGRYLRTVRKCLHDDIRRGGIVQLEVLSFLVFTLIAVGAVVFLLLSGEGLSEIPADRFHLFALLETAAAGLLFLCNGLLSRAFHRKTFAFKIFEDQMMKVETNADGTVYVPINEDSSEEDAPLSPAVFSRQPTASAASAASANSANSGKSYIKEISLVMTAEGDEALSENTEPFIL